MAGGAPCEPPLQFQVGRLSTAVVDAIEGCGISAVEEVDNEFVCVVCTQPCFGGVQTSCCEHLLHSRCLQQWLAVRRTCPHCAESLAGAAEPSRPLGRVLRSIINTKRVACPQGCGAEFPWEGLEAHVRSCCSATPMVCPHEGCAQEALRDRIQRHVAECEHGKVVCECSRELKRRDLLEHRRKSCPKASSRGSKHWTASLPLRTKEWEARNWAAKRGADFDAGVLLSLCYASEQLGDVHYEVIMTTRPLGVTLKYDEAKQRMKVDDVVVGGQAEYLGIGPGHCFLAYNGAGISAPDHKAAIDLFRRETKHLRPLYPKEDRLFLVRGDDDGRKAWYFVLVENESYDEFQRQLNEDTINLRQHGEILASAYGEIPPQSVKDKVYRRVGIPLDSED